VLDAWWEVLVFLKAKKRGIETHVGGVVQIPIDENRVGFGQVVAKRLSTYLVIVFKTAYARSVLPELQEIVLDSPAFVAETLDAKIWNGDWPIAGNIEPDVTRVPFPVYKVTVGNIRNWQVESYDGKRHREAKPWELDALQFRTVVGPIRLQRALQALHGAGQWNDAFRLMEYEFVRRMSTIAV
jgi:hypothetical protein